MKPTLDEVAAHIREKGYTFDAERFWNYYESKGWVIGRNKMKSWKSACVTWMKNKESDPRFREVVDRTEESSEPSEADRFLMECMARSQSSGKEVK